MDIIVTIKHKDEMIQAFGMKDVELMPMQNFLLLVQNLQKVTVNKVLELLSY